MTGETFRSTAENRWSNGDGPALTLNQSTAWPVQSRRFHVLALPFLTVDASFKKACEAMEVAILFDETHFGYQSFRVDQIFERHIVQIQLA